MPSSLTPRFLTALSLAALCAIATGDDWLRYRGNDGNGHGDATDLPAEWASTKNVVWKSELPAAGSSSPTVVGDRIYLTCYSGYAQDRQDPGNQEDLRRHVLCLDRSTGKILWQKEFEPKLPESDYSGGNNTHHGYATSTPASDGEHLYVFFGKSGVYCLNPYDGKTIWHTSVGEGTKGWGSAASPILFQDLLIVNASVESGKIVALDKKTGKEQWTHPVKGLWSTPNLVPLEGGRTELVISAPQEIRALDPQSGEQLWRCDGIPDRGYTCPSPVVQDGVVYVVGGRQNTAIAVKAGGKGDVTESHVLWRTSKGSNVSSCVVYDGVVYWVHEKQGTFFALDAENGDVLAQDRLDPKPGLIYSSIAVADGKLFAFSQDSGAYVFAAKPEYELLAHNTFEDDGSRVNAVPVFHNGQLLLRTDKALYCIGRK